MKQLIVEALLPVIATIASAVVPILIAAAVARFQKWTGMEMEARHREALQSALANAARMIAAGATKQAGYEYVWSSVPDAMAAFGVLDFVRFEKLLSPHLAVRPTGS